ncbi:MAG: bifunctional glutamate N-acetyltransferase/amino-acid acetyltransferase ArgJ [bacterium]|nr:bifunctional glutamate N-acetyltransferase/amino-acid acetyltransferase ArgJ [bacterium]
MIGKHKSIRGGVAAAQGFRATGTACGIKKTGKPDLALIASDTPAAAAAVFTTNRVVAAPIVWTRQVLRRPELRAVIVNSGNANACTGDQGLLDARRVAEVTACALGTKANHIAVSSTGVIGQPLPTERILQAVPALARRLSRAGSSQAALAILTTDTCPKSRAVELTTGGKRVRVGGIAKGSGMIHPDMATMLAFITTDAAVSPSLLKKALKEAVDLSFHRITVDGDTSTNDMVLMMANGASAASISEKNRISSRFQDALNAVCLDLAQAIVMDGEGATKFVTIRVVNGRDEKTALAIAKKIAQSSLVKTALFGEDANWGRILSAAGNAGVPIRPEWVDIYFDRVQLVKEGIVRGGDQEKRATKILQKRTLTITVDLNLGSASSEVYTSDLSIDYVKINADYRS